MKDGGIATRCVAFSESEITGYDLLRRAQMPVIVDVSNGISVCKIGPTSGCNYPAQKCFCDCQDLNGTCIYWMYYYQDKGQWKYAALGAGSQKVKDGDVNGWVYGAGTTTGGAFPPVISYEQICDAAPPPVTPDAHPVTPTLASAPASTVASVVVTPTSIARVTATVVISTPESYIGLGVQPPNASWGLLARYGASNFRFAPWQLFIPSFFICTTMLSLYLLGDGLRDALDPKLRR